MWNFSNRLKPVALVIGAQALCLALGLVMYHEAVVSSVKSAMRIEAWQSLKLAADKHLAALGNSADANATLRAVAETLDDRSSTDNTQFMVVDEAWRPVINAGGTAESHPLDWRAFPATQSPDQRDPRDAAQRGMFALAARQQIACAVRLGAAGGYLIAHRPVDTLQMPAEVIERPLVQSGLITFVWLTGVMSVTVYLIVTRLYDHFLAQNSEANTLATQRMTSMLRMRDAVIFGLAKLTESRDPDTGFHLERIALYCSKMARHMMRHPAYRHLVTPEFARLIEISSTLHDIGKVGVEDAVLLKPGLLTRAERQRMQHHAQIGGRCLEDIEQQLGSSNFLQMAREIAFSHHERWDGTGYPAGVAGEEIPLAARITAIADVYEALSTRRVYKEPWPHERCVAYIRDQAGKHFDPQLVQVFLEIEPQIRAIAQRYTDEDENETYDCEGTDLPSAAASADFIDDAVTPLVDRSAANEDYTRQIG